MNYSNTIFNHIFYSNIWNLFHPIIPYSLLLYMLLLILAIQISFQSCLQYGVYCATCTSSVCTSCASHYYVDSNNQCSGSPIISLLRLQLSYMPQQYLHKMLQCILSHWNHLHQSNPNQSATTDAVPVLMPTPVLSASLASIYMALCANVKSLPSMCSPLL